MKITFLTLKKWEENKVFVIENKKTSENLRLTSLLYSLRSGDDHDCLEINDLLTLFKFFHICKNNSSEHIQVIQALHTAFEVFDGKPWFQTIIDAGNAGILDDAIEAEQRFEMLSEQADTVCWIANYFNMLSESYIVSKLKLYQEAMHLLVSFSRMTPRKWFELTLLRVYKERFHADCDTLTTRTMERIEKTGFQQEFILTFLEYSSDRALGTKIFSTPERARYSVELASCFAVLFAYKKYYWNYNVLNTRLVWTNPEKAADLYSIFAQFAKKPPREEWLLSQAIYQKIMHPTVLNNLPLLKEQVFGNKIINDYVNSTQGIASSTMREEITNNYAQWSQTVVASMDGMIAMEFLYQIYSCLTACLPKDMITEIFFRLLLLTPNTLTNDKLKLSLRPLEKRILFPLSNSMVNQLDDEDLADLRLALSDFSWMQYKVFNQLSHKNIVLLLEKLGPDCLQKTLFSFKSSMIDLLNQMPLDCQKKFFTCIGSDYLKEQFGDTHKCGFYILEKLEKELFIFLLDTLGSLKYIVEILSKTVRFDSSFDGKENWTVEDGYIILGKISQFDRELVSNAFHELGRTWLLATNCKPKHLRRNLSHLDTDFQIWIIQQIGSFELQKMFNRFARLHHIFKFKSTETQSTLINLIDTTHLENLVKTADAETCEDILRTILEKDRQSAVQIFDILRIKSPLLLKTLITPNKIASLCKNVTLFISVLKRIHPIFAEWIDDEEGKLLLELFDNLPKSFDPAFISHLSSINKFPSWNFFNQVEPRVQVALCTVLPDSLFKTKPISLEQLEKIDSHDVYTICLHKMPAEQLQAMLNHPDFLKSIQYRSKAKVFACLLEIFPGNQLKSIIKHNETYQMAIQYLPCLQEETVISKQPDSVNFGFFEPVSDSVNHSDLKESSIQNN